MSAMMYGKIQKMTFALLTVVALLLCQCTLAQASDLRSVQVRSAPLQSDTISRDGMVRVYLSSLGNPTSLDLTVQGHYSLSSSGEFIANGSRLHVGFSPSTGSLTLTYGGQTYHMGQRFSLRRHSAGGANGILIAQSRDSQNPYPGDLSFEAVYGGGTYTLYTIAHIYIENYLYGVLPYEMGNASGLEALKAQAVAARTYTVRMMEKRASGRYDVKDTTSDQVYRGTPSGNANCVAAVDATKGIVLMYGSEYITTYYSASNGGQTETARTGAAYAYMKVKDDPFDYANPSSTVKKKTVYEDLTKSSNPSGLIALLKSKAIATLQRSGYPASAENTTLKTLKSITPHSPMYASPSRVYTKMDFTFAVSTQNAAGQAALVTLTETCGIFTELETLLGMGIQSMQNELWSVEKGNGTFVLQARRYGHGMGMSQRGAMYMARLGYTYDQILGFYYEGCRRVKHSFINKILSASSSDQQMTVEPPAELDNQNTNKWTGTVALAGNSTSLAIRASAQSNAKVIGAAANGALVELLFQEGAWYQIRFGETVGFVPAESLTVAGTPAQNQQQAEASSILGFAAVTASDYVNLRASGSMSAKVVGTAPAGAVLTVFSQSGAWAKVQYQALAAYVNTNFISSITDNYPSPGLSSGSRKATVVTENGTGTVNLRQSASVNAQLVDRLAAGTAVTILSDDGSWCRVSCDAGEGYILSEYIRYTEEELPPENDGQPGDSSAETETDQEGSMDTPRYAVVHTASGSLNLRREAHTAGQVLAAIPRGAQVTVVAAGNEWTAVRYGGYEGYVMTRYLSFQDSQPEQDETKPETAPPARTAYVSTQSGSLNLRIRPSLSSGVLTAIPPFAAVKVTSYGNGWCGVRYNGFEGYAATRYLRFEQEQQPDEEPPAVQEQHRIMWVTTASGSLNLRSEPDGRSQILVTIPQHAQVTLNENGAEWSAVTYGSHTGYVMTKFLSSEKPAEQENAAPPSAGEETPSQPEQEKPAEPFVTHGGIVLDVTLDIPSSAPFATVRTDARVYSMCSENGTYLYTVPAGETVEILLEGKYWCCIAYQNQQGYCLTNDLNER